jgi:hypothetical protein
LRLYWPTIPRHSALCESLSRGRGKDNAAIAALQLKLHDAQSCIAREYGLPTGRTLRNYVDWCNSKLSTDRKDVIPLWLHKAYGHDTERADPLFAAQRLQRNSRLRSRRSFSGVRDR